MTVCIDIAHPTEKDDKESIMIPEMIRHLLTSTIKYKTKKDLLVKSGYG